MLTSSIFYAEALGDSEKLKTLLLGASISVWQDELLIVCKDDPAVQAIRKEIVSIAKRAIALGIKNIQLIENGVVRNSVDPLLIIQWDNYMPLKIPLIETIPSSANEPLAVIRMNDHKGLFITDRLALMDKAHPNDWTGGDVLKYNIQEHFDVYISNLLKHQSLESYALICLDGNGNKEQQIINAWMTTWRGDLVRVVQVLHQEYL